jgi:hypothetical protein
MGLDSVELLYRAERELGVEMPDRTAETIVTVEDFARAFERFGAEGPYAEIEWKIIRIISDQQGIPLNTIT